MKQADYVNFGRPLCLRGPAEGIREEAHDPEDNEEADRDKKTSATGILFLVLTVVYLAAVGVFEIIGRLGIAQPNVL